MVRPSIKRRKVSVEDFTPPGDNSLSSEQNVNEVQNSVPPQNQEVIRESVQEESTRPKRLRNDLGKNRSMKKTGGGKVLLIIIIIIVFVGAGIVGATIVPKILGSTTKSKDITTSDINTNNQTETKETDLKLEERAEDGSEIIRPGIKDIANGTNTQQNSDAEKDVMVKDLQGISVIPNYTVSKIETVVDMVNYKKHRAITDDGMELLWLDANYKGKSYRITVPFKIFKELDPEGITVVNMEVLHLENGNQIISYMNVREDYKSKLEKGLR